MSHCRNHVTYFPSDDGKAFEALNLVQVPLSAENVGGDDDVFNLIWGLLYENPEKRHGHAEVKASPAFKGGEEWWTKVETCAMPSPLAAHVKWGVEGEDEHLRYDLDFDAGAPRFTGEDDMFPVPHLIFRDYRRN